MSVEIYYFSGTGNSLAIARGIAKTTGGRLVPIASVVEHDRITTDADAIGIVFPVYYGGLVYIPLIVQRFVAKLDGIGTKYVFAVCTFGGGAGRTMELLDEMIRARGGRLTASFGVRMPQNAFDKPFENREKLIRKAKGKLPAIAECVNARQSRGPEVDGFWFRPVVKIVVWMANSPLSRPLFVRPMCRLAGYRDDPGLSVSEIMPKIDRSYRADENCTGCGTCAKVCPVHNIAIVDGKPEWQHRCENCLACVNWCPRKAIHGFGELHKQRRYHHPDVTLSDFLLRDK